MVRWSISPRAQKQSVTNIKHLDKWHVAENHKIWCYWVTPHTGWPWLLWFPRTTGHSQPSHEHKRQRRWKENLRVEESYLALHFLLGLTKCMKEERDGEMKIKAIAMKQKWDQNRAARFRGKEILKLSNYWLIEFTFLG